MPAKATIPRPCEHCGAPFLTHASELRRGGGRYCSKRCANRVSTASHCTRIDRICEVCGAAFTAKAHRVRDGAARYCSRLCGNRAMQAPFAERFWANVQKTDTCWLWTGTTVVGYGVIYWNGMVWKAHRASWVVANGPIPEDALILHDCPGGDNKRCVNPAHLRPGTNAENMADGVRKGQFRRKAWRHVT